MTPSSSFDATIFPASSPAAAPAFFSAPSLYVAPLLNNTKFPRSLFASSIIVAVVSTFARNAPIGSSSVECTPLCPAQWTTPILLLLRFFFFFPSSSSKMTFFNCFSIASIALSDRYPSTKTNASSSDFLLDDSSRFRFAFLCPIGHGPSCRDVTSMPTTTMSLKVVSRRRCSTQWEPMNPNAPETMTTSSRSSSSSSSLFLHLKVDKIIIREGGGGRRGRRRGVLRLDQQSRRRFIGGEKDGRAAPNEVVERPRERRPM